MPNLVHVTYDQTGKSKSTIQNLSKSVSFPTHGRKKIKHDRTTLATRNAGKSADMKANTINKLTAKGKVKCLEIPHYLNSRNR